MVLLRTSCIVIPLSVFLGFVQGSMNAFFVGLNSIIITVVLSLMSSIIVMSLLSNYIKHLYIAISHERDKYWSKLTLLLCRLFLMVGLSVFCAVNISAILSALTPQVSISWNLDTYIDYISVWMLISLGISAMLSLLSVIVLACNIIYFTTEKFKIRSSIIPIVLSFFLSSLILMPLYYLDVKLFVVGTLVDLLLCICCWTDIHKFVRSQK